MNRVSHTFHTCSIIPPEMQGIDSEISEWKVWGNMPKRFSRAKMTCSQVPYTLLSRVSSWMHSGEWKNLTCLSISFRRTSTGDSESRGDHNAQSCCYIISVMLSLGFLSHRLMEGWVLLGFFFFFLAVPQGKEKCRGIQWDWLWLICLEMYCGHIHSIVNGMSGRSTWLSSRNSLRRWGKLHLCSRDPNYICGF